MENSSETPSPSKKPKLQSSKSLFSKSADGSLKLPEKYENLGDFFNSLDCSIRLLRLKRSMTSFTNISPKIETLTDRRFTHSDLAQLKFILPEAIAIKKILVFDERTSCMKPDLHVTINPDAVEFDAKLKSVSRNLSLRKLFRERLKDFWKSHPEGDEIPEEILPEPFSRPKHDPLLDMLKTPLSLPRVTLLPRATLLSTNTEIYVPVPTETSVDALAVPVSESSLKISSTSEVAKSHQKPSSSELVSVSSSSEACRTIHGSSESFTLAAVTRATPTRFVSTPSRLMTATTALKPPKRPFMSPNDNSTSSPDELVKHPPSSRRSLKFNTYK